MKLAFLDLPADERRLYIEQAAVRRNISPVVLEKDSSNRPVATRSGRGLPKSTRRISRLAMRSRGPGDRTDFPGKGNDPPH